VIVAVETPLRLQKICMEEKRDRSMAFLPHLGAVCGGTDPTSDDAAVPWPRAPRSLPVSTFAAATPLPARAVAVLPSGRGLFFPKRRFRCHRKTCATIVVNMGCCHPGEMRPASWAMPRAGFVSSQPCSMAHHIPLHHTNRRTGVLSGAWLLSEASGGLAPSVRLLPSHPVRSGSPSLPSVTRLRAHADAIGPLVPSATVRRYQREGRRRCATASTVSAGSANGASTPLGRPWPLDVEVLSKVAGRWSPPRVSAGRDTKEGTPTQASSAARPSGLWP